MFFDCLPARDASDLAFLALAGAAWFALPGDG